MIEENSKAKRRGRPTSAGAIELTNRIIAVGTRMFLDKGYEKTSIEEISILAGVAKRSLYSRFSSKADLFRQVVLTYTNNTLGQLRDDRDDQRHLEQRLYDGCVKVLKIKLDPDVIAMERLIVAEGAFFPELVESIEMARRQGQSYLQTILERDTQSANGPSDLAQFAASLLWDLVIAPPVRDAVLAGASPKLTPEIKNNLRNRIDLFLNGYLNTKKK